MNLPRRPYELISPDDGSFVLGRRDSHSVVCGRRGDGRIRPAGIVATGGSGLVGKLLPALFFLLAFLRQIALAFFELVIGRGQEGS